MLKYEGSDGCWALVERVKERIHRCESAQKQAYILAIQHGAHAYEYPNSGMGSPVATKFDHLIPLIGDVQDATSVLHNVGPLQSSSPADGDIMSVPDATRNVRTRCHTKNIQHSLA
jgi:hypothetical protein